MGVIQWLGSTLFRLMPGWMPRSVRLIEQAAKLALEGSSAEAVSLFENDAGLTADLYADRGRLRDCLRQRMSGENPNLAALYIKTLAWALWKADRSRDALAVAEADFGIEPEDYGDPVRLAVRLRARLAPVEPEIAVQMIQFLSESLGLADREVDRLIVWEADLGLERAAKQSEILEAVKRRVAGLRDPEAALIYVFGLFGAFMAAGRKEEASFALHGYLGIEEEDYRNPERLLSKIPGSVEPLDNIAAAVIASLGTTQLAHGQSALPLLEALLGVGPDSYREPERLVAILQERLASLLPGWTWVLKSFLMGALIAEGREREALAVGHAAVRSSFEEDADAAAELGAMLRERRDLLSEERLSFFVGMLSASFLAGEQPQEAVSLLEGFTHLRPEDYRSASALKERLSIPLEKWQVALSGGVLSSLLQVLRVTGEKEKAALLVEIYVDRFGPKASFEGLDFVPGLLSFFDAWLEYFGFDPDRRPLEMCRSFVTDLRQKLEFRGVDLRDRADYIAQTAGLRHRVVETGLFWSEWEGNPKRAREIALDVLLWDAELMQRLLLERFLLERIPKTPPGKPPELASGKVDPDWRDSYLPNEALTRRTETALEEDVVELTSLPQEAASASAQLQRDDPALFQKARDLISRGVDKAALAGSIGSGELLLRAMFGSQGQLLWFLLRSDGQAVEILAKGAGEPGDLERLRWAAARHDFQMALVNLQKKALPGIRVMVLEDAGRALEALEELLFLPAPAKPPDDLAGRIETIFERYTKPDYKHRVPFLRLLGSLPALLDVPSDPKLRPNWAQNARTHLRDFRGQIQEHPPGKLQPALNQMTSDYLEAIGRVWDLDVIDTVLSPDLDLVFQVDDGLQTVPMAHVLVGGEPLFRKVRSVRSSLAPLMTALQLESERGLRRDQDRPERLLSVSYFKEGDGAGKGADWLQHGFSVLATKYGLEAYDASGHPVGSVSLLRAVLEDLPGIRVLAICGHGDLYRSGIQLPTGEGEADQGPVSLWDGSGCDLSAVDWLWMVSCSIGRLSQNGDRDVEGFCVRLAIHRARSVAAFRWPVHSLEAVSLVNESTHHYLETLRNGRGSDVRCLRARALNDARKSFFGDGVNPPHYPHVGLNTAAACELFGLG